MEVPRHTFPGPDKITSQKEKGEGSFPFPEKFGWESRTGTGQNIFVLYRVFIEALERSLRGAGQNSLKEKGVRGTGPSFLDLAVGK